MGKRAVQSDAAASIEEVNKFFEVDSTNSSRFVAEGHLQMKKVAEQHYSRVVGGSGPFTLEEFAMQQGYSSLPDQPVVTAAYVRYVEKFSAADAKCSAEIGPTPAREGRESPGI